MYFYKLFYLHDDNDKKLIISINWYFTYRNFNDDVIISFYKI